MRVVEFLAWWRTDMFSPSGFARGADDDTNCDAFAGACRFYDKLDIVFTLQLLHFGCICTVEAKVDWRFVMQSRLGRSRVKWNWGVFVRCFVVILCICSLICILDFRYACENAYCCSEHAVVRRRGRPRKMSAFSTLVTVGLRFPNNPHPPSMYLDKAHCTFSDVIDPPDDDDDSSESIRGCCCVRQWHLLANCHLSHKHFEQFQKFADFFMTEYDFICI